MKPLKKKKHNQILNEKSSSQDDFFENVENIDDHFLKCTFIEKASWTVGEVKKILCESAEDIEVFSPLKIKFLRPEYKYSMKVLKVEKIYSNKFILHVTGYKTGNYKQIPFMIYNENQKFVIKDLSWEITSILDKGVIKTQYHPPYGPWAFNHPYWYGWLGGGFIAILIGLSLFLIRKHFSINKIKKRIEERLDKRTVLQYFIYQLRIYFLSKQNDLDNKKFLENLKIIFLEYLENRFMISTEYSKKIIVKKISKLNLNLEKKKKFQDLYLEIDKVLENSEEYSQNDLDQLLNSLREWVYSYEEKRKEVK